MQYSVGVTLHLRHSLDRHGMVLRVMFHRTRSCVPDRVFRVRNIRSTQGRSKPTILLYYHTTILPPVGLVPLGVGTGRHTSARIKWHLQNCILSDTGPLSHIRASSFHSIWLADTEAVHLESLVATVVPLLLNLQCRYYRPAMQTFTWEYRGFIALRSQALWSH